MKRPLTKRRLEWLVKQCADSQVPLICTDEKALADGAEILRKREVR